MAGTPVDGPDKRPAYLAHQGRGRRLPEPVPPRAAPRPRPARRRRAPLPLAAAVTTGWAAIVSYAVVVGTVAVLASLSGGGSVASVFRLGTAGWLLSHGVPVTTGAGRVGLVPLAVCALAAWRTVRAGAHTIRAIGGRRSGSARLAGLAAVGVALVLGLLGAVAAALADAPGLRLSVPVAGLTLGLFGLVAAGAGAAVESGVASAGWARLPLAVRDGSRTGLVAALLILGAGAAAAGISVALAGGDASDMVSAYHTGVAGQLGLTLICLGYAPNLAVWAAAYLIGPGFTVGAGTVVSAGKVTLGALPAVPVLAGLPSAAVSGPGTLLLGVPLAAGMAAGWLLTRRYRTAPSGWAPRTAARRPAPPGVPAPTWGRLLAAAVLAGPVAGLLLGLAAWLSGGPLGSGRLAALGPSGWTVGLVAAGVVALGAVIAAAATRVLASGGRSG